MAILYLLLRNDQVIHRKKKCEILALTLLLRVSDMPIGYGMKSLSGSFIFNAMRPSSYTLRNNVQFLHCRFSCG